MTRPFFLVDLVEVARSLGVIFANRRDRTHGLELHATNGCPICHDGEDRFMVWPLAQVGGRFHCRVCHKTGDAITLVRLARRLSFPEACRELNLDPADVIRERGQGTGIYSCHPEPPTRTEKPKPPAWAEITERVLVPRWQEALWHNSAALNWLRDRGFYDSTIERMRFGFNSRGNLDALTYFPEVGHQVAHGITIPWFATDGQLYGVNIRRLLPKSVEPSGENPKYRSIYTSAKPVMMGRILGGSPDCLVVEGEFDLAMARQELRETPGLDILCFGSTSDDPSPYFEQLDGYQHIWLAYDLDEAGDRAAKRWWGDFPKARRVRFPGEGKEGEDIGDFVLAGGSLPLWVAMLRRAEASRAMLEVGPERGHTRVTRLREGRDVESGTNDQRCEFRETKTRGVDTRETRRLPRGVNRG